VKESIERLRKREVPTIRPRVIMEDGKRRVLMPGDAGYY
jgi:hypothetical protein